MKKIYFLLSTALLAIPTFVAQAASTNGTVTDGWLMVEDFQNAKPGDTVTVYDIYNNPAEGTGEVTSAPADSDNLVAVFRGGNYNTVLEIPVTLPAGKTISDYKSIAFDLYRYSDDDNYKQMYIGIDNSEIYIDTDYIEQAPETTWTVKSYDITAVTTSGNAILLHIGIKNNNAHYAIDNLRLEMKDTDTPVEPGDYYETANGNVTDGVLMLNDFQHHGATDVTLTAWNRWGGEAAGEVKTAADPTDAKNIVARFSGTSDYNTVHEINVTLPAGKTLADYTAIKFDLYRYADDANYKRMRVQADDHVIFYMDEGGYEEQAPEGTWTEKSYAIDKTNTVGNSFKLRLGIESDAPNYLIDNVRLVDETTTGITDITIADNGVSVIPSAGGISITSEARTEARIYAIDGKLVCSTVVDGSTEINLVKGVYIVAIDTYIVKMIVN